MNTNKDKILTTNPCVYYSEEQDGTVFKYREQVIGNMVLYHYLPQQHNCLKVAIREVINNEFAIDNEI